MVGEVFLACFLLDPPRTWLCTTVVIGICFIVFVFFVFAKRTKRVHRGWEGKVPGGFTSVLQQNNEHVRATDHRMDYSRLAGNDKNVPSIC